MSTIFGFKCNNCGTQIDQLTQMIVGDEGKEDQAQKVKCPDCGLENCEYQTKL